MNQPTRILIAGIGNIFLGDDAFGVEVAQRMARMPMPPGVRVVDFGIRGIDLTYALLEGVDVAILVDAVPRGQAPGTVYLIEPEVPADAQTTQGTPMLDMHNMDPARVLAVVKSLAGDVRRILLVGCEPTPFDPDQDIQMELSPPVRAAVDEAIAHIQSLVEEILAGDDSPMAYPNTIATGFPTPSPGTPGEGWSEGLSAENF